jgi:hypothetical protein
MKLKMYGIATAVALAFSVAAQAQTSPGAAPSTPRAERSATTDRTPDRNAMKAEEDRIDAEYKADKERCKGLKGNEHEVCEKEAKAKEKVAMAELKAKYEPTPANRRKVEEARAEAKYEVAKERCDALKGKEQSACEKEAKAEYARAKAGLSKSNASAGSTSTSGTAK